MGPPLDDMLERSWLSRQADCDLRTIACASRAIGEPATILGCEESSVEEACHQLKTLLNATKDPGCGSPFHPSLLRALGKVAETSDFDDARIFAVALLLRQAIVEDQSWQPDGRFWGEIKETIERSSVYVRGALTRWCIYLSDRTVTTHKGFWWKQYGTLDGCKPAEAELDEQLSGLRTLVKGATQEQRRLICNADYNRHVDRHLAALNRVIDEQNCIFIEGDHWYPLEVVELTSYSPESEIGQVCTALLIIDDIVDGRHLRMDYRWRPLAFAIRKIRSPNQRSILIGLRAMMDAQGVTTPGDFSGEIAEDFEFPILPFPEVLSMASKLSKA